MKEPKQSKCALVKEIKNKNKVTVNGQDMEMEVSTTVICCPTCGRAVFNLGNNVPITDVYKWCTENNESLEKNSSHCQGCGQKLLYPIVIDAEFKEISSEVVEVKKDGE